MKLRAGHSGQVLLDLDAQEALILDNLVGQVIGLLQTHSSVDLDPDPLLASLEIGGTEELPDDPALARLLPNAYEDDEHARNFRRVTEQSLINRKLEDATVVATTLSVDSPTKARQDSTDPVTIVITAESYVAWLRTLTAIRLAMSARLGVEDVEDITRLESDSESSSALMIFQWLGGLTEALLQLEQLVSEPRLE